MAPGPNDIGASRGHIMVSVSRSLERLQTDHIDLYQIHQSDIVTPVEETMRALDDLVAQRMIRYVGVSNWEAWKIMKANGIADKRGWARVESCQAYYSIAGRDLFHELVPSMQDQSVARLVWSPLAGGYLAGENTRPAAQRVAMREGAPASTFRPSTRPRPTKSSWRCATSPRRMAFRRRGWRWPGCG